MKTDKFDFSEDFFAVAQQHVKEIAGQAEKQSGYEATVKKLKDCTEAFKELTAECKVVPSSLLYFLPYYSVAPHFFTTKSSTTSCCGS